MMEIVKAPNLPRTCKGKEQHKLVSREQLTRDGRCKTCQQDRKRELHHQRRESASPDGRYHRRELPTWCQNLEHYLERDEDVVKSGTVMCKQCHRETLKRKGGAREARFLQREATKTKPVEAKPEPAPQGLIFMYKLRGVRNALGLSTYELASFSRIPHKQYVAIEQLEEKADEKTQRKLVNGVWLGKRQYQRDVAGVAI